MQPNNSGDKLEKHFPTVSFQGKPYHKSYKCLIKPNSYNNAFPTDVNPYNKFNKTYKNMFENYDAYPTPIKLHKCMEEEILPIMRDGYIKETCLQDEDILSYGNDLCEMSNSDCKVKTIRQQLRLFSSVIYEMKKEDHCNPAERIISARDIFHPSKFDLFIRTMKRICGYDDHNGEPKSSTAPFQYGPRFRQFSDYILMKLRDTEFIGEIENIESWQNMYDTEYKYSFAPINKQQEIEYFGDKTVRLRKFSKRQIKDRVTWTPEMKYFVISKFKHFIDQNKYPPTDLIESEMESIVTSFPQLRGKSSLVIKAFISNTIKKRK